MQNQRTARGRRQTNRYLLARCSNCAMPIRTTRKWLVRPGLGDCACGGQFRLADASQAPTIYQYEGRRYEARELGRRLAALGLPINAAEALELTDAMAAQVAAELRELGYAVTQVTA